MATDTKQAPSDEALAQAQQQANLYAAHDVYPQPAQLPQEPTTQQNQGPELVGTPAPQAGSLASASQPQNPPLEPQQTRGSPQGGSLAAASRPQQKAPAVPTPQAQSSQQPQGQDQGFTAADVGQKQEQGFGPEDLKEPTPIAAGSGTTTLPQDEGFGPEDVGHTDTTTLASKAIEKYKTAADILNASSSGQISPEVAQAAITERQKVYQNANPDQKKAMDAEEAAAEKALQPKAAEQEISTSPAADTFSSLLTSGTPFNLAKLPIQEVQNYVDDLYNKGKLSDQEYANRLAEIKKAKDIMQNDSRMHGGVGLGATQFSTNQMLQAEKEVAAHLDIAAPGFLKMRPQQAATELVKAGENLPQDWKALLTSGPQYNKIDPTGPGVPLLQKSAGQLSATLQQGIQAHQEQLARFALNDKEQAQVDSTMRQRGMIPYSPEFLAAHNMGPKAGAMSGGLPLAEQVGMAALSMVPMPWDAAIDTALARVMEKAAVPFSAGGRTLVGWGEGVGKNVVKNAVKGAWAGAGGVATQIAINAPQLWANMQDPDKRTQMLETIAAELGLPIVGGAFLGSGLWGAGNTAKFIAAVLRSSSPEIRLAMEPGAARALSTEIPYRATQGPVVQTLGRALGDYLSGTAKGVPFAAAVSQGDTQKFISDVNQFGLYSALLHAPDSVLNAIRGSNFDHIFTYRGEDPNKIKAPPQTHYGDSYFDPHQGGYISLDASVDKALKGLDESRAATATHAQDITKPYANVYPLPDEVFAHVATGNNADPDSAGFVNRDPFTGKIQAFFKASEFDPAGLHESIGHVADKMMGPHNQAAFNHLLSQMVDMDGVANAYANRAKPGTGKVTFADLPDQAEVTPGNPQYDPNKEQWAREHGNLTKQRAYEEARAETLQALWSGQTADKWTKSPSLLRRLNTFLGASAESLGFRTTTPDVDGPLGVQKSVAAAKILDAYLHDFAVGNVPPTGATKNYFGVPWAQGKAPATPTKPPVQAPITLWRGKGPPPAGAAPVPAAPGPRPGGGGFATAKPANVLAVRGVGGQPLPQQPQLPTQGAPPAPPPAAPIWTPGAGLGAEAQPSVDESVVKGLMKQGFSREQAQDFAARGTVSPVNRRPAEPQEKPAQVQVKQPEVQVKPTQPQVQTHPLKKPEQWDLNETIERGRIADQLQQETGKHVDLNDPRVDQIYTQGQGAAEATDAQHAEIKKLIASGVPAGQAQRQVLGAPVKRLGQPEAAPMAQATGTPANTRTLRATWFGRNPDGSVDTTDEGRMSYYDAHHGAWGADLLDKNLVGVAVSKNFLEANGIDPRKSPSSQGFKVRVTAPNGKTEVVDIVDIGPENKIDMTYGLGKKLGLSDNSHLDLQLLDKQGNTVSLKDTPRGGAGTAYMPSGGGGGGGGGGPAQAWTPYRGPAPTYPWSQPTGGAGAPAAPGEQAARAPAGGYTSPVDVEPENVPVTQAAAFYPRGAETEAGVSPAMQQAQYFGTSGGGYGLGPIYPGIGGAPEAPSYMPSGRRGARIGGVPLEGGEESTLGEPNVPGFEQLTPHLNQGIEGLKRAQKIHASLLSPDDSRVRKQKDNYFKGEHFVKGDPVHQAALANVPQNERVALAAGQTAIANKQPMHLTYASAPPAEESPITRQSREVHYDASSPQARLLGQTNARLAGHSIIPVSLGISLARRKGDPNSGYIQGISTSVAAHNHHLINQELARMGESSPYPSLGSDKFHNDFSGYVQNLLHGYRGTGVGHQPSTEEFPSHVDPHYAPYRLKQREADFMNAIVNNTMARHSPKLRELARAAGTLQTEEGEVNPMLHRIDKEHIHDEGIDRAAKQTWRTQILEPTIRTFNAGLIHALHESPEHIPQEIRPNVPGYRQLTETLGRELGSERGRPDVGLGAAFMPGKKPPKPLSPEEHEELAGNIRKQWLAGKLRTPEYMERMREVPEPGEDLGPAFMPMAGKKALGFKVARALGRTFETPLPGGGQRFEIDDRDFKFKPTKNSYVRVPGYREPPKNALEERYVMDKRGPGIMPLADAIDHPELFENYPWLRNTKISMDPTIPHYGHYQAPWVDGDGNMRGDHLVLRRPNDVETLAHEIQHAVQHYEDFAGKGSNSSYLFEQMRNDAGVRDELRKQWDAAYPERASMDEVQLINNEADRNAWTKKRLKEMADAMYQMDPGEIEARVAGRRAIRLGPEGREAAAKEGILVPETSPKQDVLDEMKLAAEYGRQAGTLSHRTGPTPKGLVTPPRSEIAYMPGRRDEFSHSSPEDFIAARNKSKRPEFLSPLAPEDIGQHKLYMNDEGTAGAAVSPEGDIQNVFNNGGGKGAGQRALAHAIRNGGRTLDAYDPYLPALYRQFGFKETGRMKFNRDYAPPNWNFEEDDDPDIVFMAHQGYPQGGEEAALKRSIGPKEKWLPNEHSTQQEDDWDQAKERSRGAVYRGAGGLPGPEAFGAGEEPSYQAGGAGRGPLSDVAYMAGGKKKAAAPPPRAISKQTLNQLGPRPKDEEKGNIWDKFAARLDKQIPGSIPLRPAYKKNGDLKIDGLGNPEFEKESGGYHLANAPILGKKALGYDQKGGVAKAPEGTVDTIAPGDLEYLNPTDRLRISYLDKASAINTYADALSKEYDWVEKEIPEALKAKDWYNDTEGYLKKHFGEHADLVANLLAATSARTGVKTNYGFAMQAYHRFARGDYDRHIQLYLKALEMKQREALAEHVAGLQHPETGENYSPTSEAHAMALYIKHHDILPTQHDIEDVTKKGAQYGMHSEKVLKVLADTWLNELEGPKTRRYTGNMTGRSIQSTGDMWVGRQLRRLGFEGHTKKPWLVQAPAESGLSNLDFAIQELAHRRAAEKRGLEPRQHQAILWTSEIKHWLNKNWAAGGDPAERDYRPMLEKYEKPEWAKRQAA